MPQEAARKTIEGAGSSGREEQYPAGPADQRADLPKGPVGDSLSIADSGPEPSLANLPANAADEAAPARFCVVGIGASGGGLEALCAFFDAMPANCGMAFVVVQHLAPEHKSSSERIAEHTAMATQVATDGLRLAADHVYTIPPRHYATLADGCLRLSAADDERAAHLPIDVFFGSLAESLGDRAIGIVLSGGGADGSIGLKRIDANGGVVIVQSPETARFGSMPRSAIATGLVSDVLAVADMPGVLLGFAGHPYALGAARLPSQARIGSAVNDILDRVRSQRGFSFSGYRRLILSRRIQRRMGLRGVLRWSEYATLLKREPQETDRLFRDLLVGTTDFFRDPDAWQTLREEVLAPLVAARAHGEPIRIWVAGCSTGEEAYSIAMLVFDVLGEQERSNPLQIFATDVNNDALQTARRGVYPAAVAARLPAGFADRFFSPTENEGLRVSRALRDAVVFGAHNLLGDQPFCRLDLVCCRNLLIYLEPERQQHALSQFHFALVPGGGLFLGSGETVGRFEDVFLPLSRQWCIYQHAQREGPLAHEGESGAGSGSAVAAVLGAAPRRAGSEAIAEQIILDRFSPAAVLVNAEFEALYFCGPTGDYLRRPRGAPTRDLLALVQEGLRSHLRNALRRALAERHGVSVSASLKRDGGFLPVRITATPAGADKSGDALLLVVFEDEPRPVGSVPGDDEAPMVRQLEGELKEVRAELQASIERLENANEDLKVANEEVLSVNEELQSINEELESGREEMLSLNEELKAENQQLRARIGEIEEFNARILRLFRNDHVVLLQLDRHLSIRAFSPAVGELCNLLPGDRGRTITDFAEDRIGSFVGEDAAAVLATATPCARELRLSDGRWWLRQMFASRDAAGGVDGIIVNYLDINDSKEASEGAVAAQRRMAETLEERVKARTAQLRALAGELSLAEERERRALAQDLHDDLGQVLAIAKIKLSSMDDHERRGALKAALKEVESLVDHANRSVRSLMMQLSPPLLQTLGLPAALEWLAEEMERIYGISVRIDDDGQPKPLAEAARTSVFRAVRELLINVAKHSGAKRAEVNCLRADERITVAVTDHGSGFDYLAEMAKPLAEASFGLLSVRERIEFLGGEMNVDSTPDDGTTITLTVPVATVAENREEHLP